MNTTQQAAFFNKAPTFYPFRQLLGHADLSVVFRPRDVAWKKYFDKLCLTKGQKVLEVGCGTGVMLSRVQKSYKVEGTGVDVASVSIATAKELFGKQLSFRVADGTKLPFADNSFDAVYSLDVLEHIQQQDKVLLEMVRVLKKGGKLLLYTINKKQTGTLNWFLGKMGVDVYKRVAHDPKLFVDPFLVRKLLEKQHLFVKEISFYDAFFSLGMNQVMTVGFMLSDRVHVPKKVMQQIIFPVASVVSRVLYPVGKFLDIPWTTQNTANSFFLLAEKI